jgi:ribosomal protein S18 acetylase RimI-like enzyme
MIIGVDHVQVAAPPESEDAARAFYGELLGLEELPKPERLRARGGVWFRAGDEELHIGVDDDFKPAWKAHPALAVSRASELRALAHRLDRAGHHVRWDGPRFYVADPFGNRLELLASHAEVVVRALRDDERGWAAAVLDERWSGVVIGGGRELRPAALPALVAEAGDERAGLLTYTLDGSDCEIVTIDALTVGAGIGGALIEAAMHAAAAAGATRVHLITTNDNLPALRLYQRHGFVLAELRRDQVAVSRRLKPEISPIGHAGIPIRDELVLERRLR